MALLYHPFPYKYFSQLLYHSSQQRDKFIVLQFHIATDYESPEVNWHVSGWQIAGVY